MSLFNPILFIDISLMPCTLCLVFLSFFPFDIQSCHCHYFNLCMSPVVWSKPDTDISNYSYFMHCAGTMSHTSKIFSFVPQQLNSQLEIVDNL